MKETCDLQNTNEPEIVPLAIAAGKRKCASCVIGKQSMKNKTGGMTSRSLEKKSGQETQTSILQNLLIHGHVMVNTVQEEVDHQEFGMVRQVKVDVEQKPVESVFE
jgi:hypothetical protein